jgi:signal transduction histidine kinase
VVVEDDGRGFDQTQASGEGLGIIGMQERIALLDGRVAVESRAGQGTTLSVQVPIR